MTFKLVVVNGEQKGNELVINKNKEIYIGRGEDCDLQLNDNSISRHHSSVWKEGGAIWIKDGESVNGTFVNSTKIEKKRELVLGDFIKIGGIKIQVDRVLPYTNPESLDQSRVFYRKDREDPTFSMQSVDPIKIERDLFILHRIGKLTQQEHNIPDMFASLLEILIYHMDISRGCIVLRVSQDKNNPIMIYRSFNEREKSFNEEVFSLNRTFLQNALLNGQGAVRAASSGRISTKKPQKDRNSLICSPIEGHTDIVGVIYIESSSQNLTLGKQDLDLLTAIGRQAGLALERALLEEKLKASEQHYRSIYQSIIEHSWDVIYRQDLDKSFILISPAIKKLLGNSPKEFIENHKLWEEKVYSQDRKLMKSKKDQVFEGQEYTLKYRMERKKKEFLWVEETCYPIKDINGNIICIQGFVKDITETKLLEEQLKHKEHLALLGEFSAGMAHEVRNPLSAMAGFAELLKRKVEKNQTKELVEKLLTEIESLNTIVNDILAYAREGRYQPKATPIFSFLKDVLSLALPKETVDKIEVKISLDPKVPTLFIDPQEMKKVLVNLIKNGVEAMAPFSNSNKKKRKVLTIQTTINNEETILSISDTGDGIREDLSQSGKIFQPFFTTRENGTGLGLAIALKIIETHGAQLRMESQSTVGTKMSIVFPMKKEKENDQNLSR